MKINFRVRKFGEWLNQEFLIEGILWKMEIKQ